VFEKREKKVQRKKNDKSTLTAVRTEKRRFKGPTTRGRSTSGTEPRAQLQTGKREGKSGELGRDKYQNQNRATKAKKEEKMKDLTWGSKKYRGGKSHVRLAQPRTQGNQKAKWKNRNELGTGMTD